MLLIRMVALLAALVLPALGLTAPQALQVADNQVRIAVMGQEDFHPDRAVAGNVRSLPDDLAARVIEHLNNTRRFSVVERAALRRVVREQQFGRDQTASDLDRVIEKTVENLPATSGWTIAAAATAADHNDVLKEFQDLGTTVGADYILYAVLEKQQGSTNTTAVPFSDSENCKYPTMCSPKSSTNWSPSANDNFSKSATGCTFFICQFWNASASATGSTTNFGYFISRNNAGFSDSAIASHCFCCSPKPIFNPMAN